MGLKIWTYVISYRGMSRNEEIVTWHDLYIDCYPKSYQWFQWVEKITVIFKVPK